MADEFDGLVVLDNLVGGLPLSWQEMADKIAASTFVDRRKDGCWATEVLHEFLGKDWITEFAQNDGHPYVTFAIAANSLPHLDATIELAVRLRLLDAVPGIKRVVKSMKTQLEAPVMGHARLQLEVASLVLRDGGPVALEVAAGQEGWHPDVVIGDPSIRVECFQMVVGAELKELLANSHPSQDMMIDGWKRIAARIVGKAAQASQAGGWLRCELDDGMFGGQKWFKSWLAGRTLSDKAATLVSGAHEALQSCGELHGLVLSSPAALNVTGHDEECHLDDGSVALRRLLSADRGRETFVVPTQHALVGEVDFWATLYEEEPTWLPWALGVVH